MLRNRGLGPARSSFRDDRQVVLRVTFGSRLATEIGALIVFEKLHARVTFLDDGGLVLAMRFPSHIRARGAFHQVQENEQP